MEHPNVDTTCNPAKLTLSNPRFGNGQHWESWIGWWADNAHPDYAIDGSWSDHDYMAHSSHDTNPTFHVDLPSSETTIERILIYPRQNCCFDRYADMKVKVGDTYCEAAQSLDAYTVELYKAAGLTFRCNNAVGSGVDVEQGLYHLHIAEIEAYGC